MGKFLDRMSQNDSKALVARARQIDTQARIAQEDIIAKLKNEKAKLELKLQDLTDFAPETTQSLRPGVANWDPTKWAKELHATKVALYENSVELQIAQSTMKEFFGDEEASEEVTIVEE
jgi:hypothetical protein